MRQSLLSPIYIINLFLPHRGSKRVRRKLHLKSTAQLRLQGGCVRGVAVDLLSHTESWRFCFFFFFSVFFFPLRHHLTMLRGLQRGHSGSCLSLSAMEGPCSWGGEASRPRTFAVLGCRACHGFLLSLWPEGVLHQGCDGLDRLGTACWSHWMLPVPRELSHRGPDSHPHLWTQSQAQMLPAASGVRSLPC